MLTHFLPARVRCRERHPQYDLNPALCQRTTVSGWTKISACFQSDHKCRKSTQNNLSETATRGRGCLRFKVMSCCRRARFSRSRSRRELEHRATRTSRSLSRPSIQPGLHLMKEPTCHTTHLPHLATDHHFGDPQDLASHPPVAVVEYQKTLVTAMGRVVGYGICPSLDCCKQMIALATIRLRARRANRDPKYPFSTPITSVKRFGACLGTLELKVLRSCGQL